MCGYGERNPHQDAAMEKPPVGAVSYTKANLALNYRPLCPSPFLPDFLRQRNICPYFPFHLPVFFKSVIFILVEKPVSYADFQLIPSIAEGVQLAPFRLRTRLIQYSDKNKQQCHNEQNAECFNFFPFFISLISYAFCRKLFYIENVISYETKKSPALYR